MRSYLGVFCIVLVGVLFAGSARAQDSLNVRIAARLQADWGKVNHLVTAGHYAYAATATRGLQVADIESPSAPVLLGGESGENFHHLCVVGERLYATVGDWVDVAELRIFSLANPAAPVILGRVALPQGPGCVAVTGNYAYIARTSHMLTVVDVREAEAPVCVASMGNYGLEVNGIAIDGNRLYIAAIYLVILDITTPAWPVPLNYFVVGEPWVIDVAVRNGHVYTVDDWEGLKVWNMADPQTPLLVGACEIGVGITFSPNFGRMVLLPNDRMMISGGDQFSLLNVADPAHPTVLATQTDAIGCAVAQGSQLVTTTPAASLALYDLSTPPAIVRSGSAAFMQMPLNVVRSGSRLYVLDRSWLWCLDATSPQLTRLGRLALEPCEFEDATTMCVVGNTVFLGEYEDSLRVVDASDPAAMTPVARIFWPVTGSLASYGNYLYASQSEGLAVLDVSNPAQPVPVTLLETEHWSGSLVIAGSRLYTQPYNQGLRVFDLATPAQPALIGQYNPGDIGLGDVHGTTAYLAYKVDYSWRGIRVVDLADPAQPLVLGQWETTLVNQFRLSPDGTRLFGTTYDTLKVLAVTETPPYPELGFYAEAQAGYAWNTIAAVTDHSCYLFRNGILQQLDYLAPDAAPEIRPLLPTALSLGAYPNPFNSTTRIAFTLPAAGQMELAVYDLLGREVTVLHRGVLTAGEHTSTLDGAGLASGLYILRLQAGTHTACAKIALLK